MPKGLPVLLFFLTVLVACQKEAPPAKQASKPPVPAAPALNDTGSKLPAFDKLYVQASPSVVDVRAFQPVQRPGNPREQSRASSLGSGFVLDQAGLVLTCASVVEDAARIELQLHNGRLVPASVYGVDPLSDLALLRIDPAVCPPALSPATPGKLRQGDWVAAFGYPFGLSHSITAGMVSAIRSPQAMGTPFGRILTDAAINPGYNGGPLLDLQGHVVGINLVPPASASLGLALPWADVAHRIQAMMEGKSLPRPWLGLACHPVDVDLARASGLASSEGALITAVAPNSPAAEAGLKKKDIVLGIAGQPVEDPQALIDAMKHLAPGQVVTLRFWRDRRERTLQLTICAQ
ncbi:MAG: trypsin-like peptidase domain-containing protein [Deltaproteobacteria bacterium]|nr:trypsin-like peptidase domain-containing protein [Deltaproteobacteria bacterium]